MHESNRIESIVAPDPIRTRATATMRVVVGASRAPDGLLCEIMCVDARREGDERCGGVDRFED